MKKKSFVEEADLRSKRKRIARIIFKVLPPLGFFYGFFVASLPIFWIVVAILAYIGAVVSLAFYTYAD